jgi:peptidoglycan hydrolase-like protein with peptidoglycan-binding domain
MRRAAALLALLAALVAPGGAHAIGKPGVAALQVALYERGLYTGTIDGIRGRQTEAAVRRLQERRSLTVDGIVGPQTRRALGPLARHPLGSRPVRQGMVGADVSCVQFLVAWHGFASGELDGRFGPRLDRAVRRFQTWAGLPADGIVGDATLAALRGPPPRSPISVREPLRAPVTSGFGPRGNRFHEGIDVPAPLGTPVLAARAGDVVYAGWNDGYGRLVVVAHGGGVETFYAHLRRIDVRVGEVVAVGEQLGRVGSSGNSSGPHLHFELRVRGAAVDPLPALR